MERTTRTVNGKEFTVRNLDEEPLTPSEEKLTAAVIKRALMQDDTENPFVAGRRARQAALSAHRERMYDE